MSYIGSPISLVGTKNIYIDNRVRIYPGVRMETHNNGQIIIGRNTSIGQNFHIISEKEPLIIGENVTVSGNVFITNIDHDYMDINKHVLLQDRKVKTTRIGEGCFIGFGVTIQAGTVLGKHCVVGANAVVRGSYPDYCVIAGVPGRIIKRYDVEAEVWKKVK